MKQIHAIALVCSLGWIGCSDDTSETSSDTQSNTTTETYSQTNTQTSQELNTHTSHNTSTESSTDSNTQTNTSSNTQTNTGSNIDTDTQTQTQPAPLITIVFEQNYQIDEQQSVILNPNILVQNTTIKSISWSQISGSTAEITTHADSSIEFTAPNIMSNEVLGFLITVIDENDLSFNQQIEVNVNAFANQLPVIELAEHIQANEQTIVDLNALIQDEDGNIESITWTQTDGPSVWLSNTDQAHTYFNAPETTQAIDFSFNVNALDNQGAKTSNNVTVTVIPVNASPTANAGNNQSTPRLSTVILDASLSMDTDEDDDQNLTEQFITSYQWAQVTTDDIQIPLTENSNHTLNLDIPYVDLESLPVTLTFELTVTDNEGLSDIDFVEVTITNQNIEPVAVASAVQSVDEYVLVNEQYQKNVITLNANASYDSDANPLALNDGLTFIWNWTADKQSLFELNDQYNALNCATPASKIISLQCVDINDQIDFINSDFTALAPIELDQTQLINGMVSFESVQVSQSTTYYFELVVIDADGVYNSELENGAQFTSVVINPVSIAPVVDIQSKTETLTEGDVGNLVAIASDIDGTVVSYLWTQTDGPVVVMGDITQATARFSAPPVLANDPQVVTFSVISIDDDALESTAQYVSFDIVGNNSLPDLSVKINSPTYTELSTATVSLTYKDSDGEVISSNITQVNGPTSDISGELDHYEIKTPNVAGDQIVEFSAVVTDNEGGQFEQTFSFTIEDTNQPPEVFVGKSYYSEGLSETGLIAYVDDDNTAESDLQVSWTQVSGPDVTLLDADTLEPYFIAPEVLDEQKMEFMVTVTDTDAGQLSLSSTATMSVFIEDHYPIVSILSEEINNEQTQTNFSLDVQLRDGDEVTQYVWTLFIDGQQIDLGQQETASYTTDNIIGDALTGNLTVKIYSTNGEDTDLVSISFIDTNNAPVAHAGRDLKVASNLDINLSASKSKDDDGDTIDYEWTQVIVDSEEPVSLTNSKSETPSLETPIVDALTEFTFELIVYDTDGSASQADQVVVSVMPVMSQVVNTTGISDTQCSDFAYDIDSIAGSLSHQTNLDCALEFEDVDGDPIVYGQDGHYSNGHLSLTRIKTAIGELPDSVGCVYDATTQLMWQIPKTMRGLGWYNPDALTNGGSEGNSNEGSNTQANYQAVNDSGLCGYDNWRMPTREELISIAHYGSTSEVKLRSPFGDLSGEAFYSSETVANDTSLVWAINFEDAQEIQVLKIGFYPVMLVRDASVSPIINAIAP